MQLSSTESRLFTFTDWTGLTTNFFTLFFGIAWVYITTEIATNTQYNIYRFSYPYPNTIRILAIIVLSGSAIPFLYLMADTCWWRSRIYEAGTKKKDLNEVRKRGRKTSVKAFLAYIVPFLFINFNFSGFEIISLYGLVQLVGWLLILELRTTRWRINPETRPWNIP